MEILGDETNEIDYNQFCLLLNDNVSSESTRFTNFFNNKQMVGAVNFFKDLDSTETDFIDTFGDN